MKPIVNINNEKTHYVAWSGGADSTLLLYLLCKELNKDGKKPVVLISESWYLTGKKKISEAKARDNIEREFIARGLEFDKMRIRSEVTVPDGLWGTTFGLQQPGLWVMQFMPVMKENSIVHFGYINGDHFWYHDNDFIDMVNSYDKMLNSHTELSFELQYTDKVEVLSMLKEFDLLKFIWYCETPERVGQPCGLCHPCQTNMKARALMAMDNIEDPELLTNIIEEFTTIKNERKIDDNKKLMDVVDGIINNKECEKSNDEIECTTCKMNLSVKES